MYQTSKRFSLCVIGFSLFFTAALSCNDQLETTVREGIFSKTSHDFGTLARGSKAVYEFKIKNTSDQPLVISSVRSSCGCTKASIPKRIIPSNSDGAITAEFNTRSFLGPKSATVTVVIAKPVYREIQLQVRGNIRGDIVFEPGQIEIRDINQGESKSASTTIHYAGSAHWEIVDVKSSVDYLRAELKQLERKTGSVKYKLSVRVTENCPVGLIRDQLTIVTNDSTKREIRLPFLAEVNEQLSVSPADVKFEGAKPGRARLIFRSNQPFLFQQVHCSDPRLNVAFSKKSRQTQLVTLTYTPSDKLRTQPIRIRFVTDIGTGLTKEMLVKFK